MKELRFDGRVVIVTGGANGMGRAHVDLLAQRGAKVLVNDIGVPVDSRSMSESNPSAAQSIVDAIRSAGGEAVANNDSVATFEGAAAIVQHAIDAFGRLDGIIHNAGVVHQGAFEELTFDDYETVRRVHLDGAVGLAHAAWPHFKDKNYGRLLFITSRAGLQGTTGLSHYGAAKAGQIGLMKCLAQEGRDHGIRVNALSPAAFNPRALAQGTDPKHPAASMDTKWWAANMRPEQVSPAALWLVHENCSLSGEVLESGGGFVGRVFLSNSAGYANPKLTLEDVQAHMDEICDERGSHVFANTGEAARDQIQRLIDAGAPPMTGG